MKTFSIKGLAVINTPHGEVETDVAVVYSTDTEESAKGAAQRLLMDEADEVAEEMSRMYGNTTACESWVVHVHSIAEVKVRS